MQAFHNMIKKIYKCKKCPKTLNFKANLYLHIEEVHKEMKCNICGKEFVNRDFRNRHARTHKEKEKGKCQICNKVCYLGDSLNRHTERHLSKTFPCDICNISLMSKLSLAYHIKKVHGEQSEESHQCFQCQNFFTSTEKLAAHLKRVHKSESSVTCPVCFKLMKPKSINSHMNEFHGDPDEKIMFNCDQCPESFQSRWFLKKHFKDCHIGKAGDWKCDPCSEQFQREIDLQNHNRNIHPEVKTKCEYDKKPLNVLDITKPVMTLMVFKNESN